ncbi:MAG: DUF58 domain-containing protein [Pseudomonadota bacterium]
MRQYPTRRAAIIMAAGLPITMIIATFAPLFWSVGAAWVAGLAGLLILDSLLATPRQTMALDVDAPKSVFVGETETLAFRYNYGDASAPKAVEARLGVNHLFSVKPDKALGAVTDDTVDMTFTLSAERRGDGQIEQLWTRWQGPLGLMWQQKVEDLSIQVPIMPNIRIVRDNSIEFFSRDARIGQKKQIGRGEGSEYEALTEFVPGMERRTIDWKHSARHRMLIAKEFSTERNHNIIFAIDSGHLMCEPVRGITKLDWSLNASLLMAYVSLKMGDRIGYFGFDKSPYFYSQPIGGAKSFPFLQRLTGSIDYSHSETNFTLSFSQLAQKLKRRTLIVVFTDFVDTTSAQLMVESLGRLLRRHILIFVSFRDDALEHVQQAHPNAPGDISKTVIANSLVVERNLVIKKLRRMGVHIIDVDIENINNAVLNKYLELKKREAI